MELKLVLANLMRKMLPQMPVTDEQLQRILEVFQEVPICKGEWVQKILWLFLNAGDIR